MSRVLLLSVRPRFAQGLLSGMKTAEVRRRFPEVSTDTTVVIYSSSPEKAVLGTMKVRALVRSTAAGIWQDYEDAIAIDRAELSGYLEGASECCVIELDTPTVWSQPVSLGAMRQSLRVEPPQSFRYLTTRQLAKLEALAIKQPTVVDLSSIHPSEPIPAFA